MSLDHTQLPAHQTLLKLLERGVEQSAKRLGRLSFSTWRLDTVSLSQGASTAADELLGLSEDQHFGTFLGIPGGGFLLMFPPKSGNLVINRFTLYSSETVDSMEQREPKVLAEVSNIIINAMVDVFADTCGQAILLSAPTPLQGTKKDILRQAREKFPAAGRPAWICYVRLKTPTFASDCDLLAFMDPSLFDMLSNHDKPAS
ncbi:MAG: hypothetical protein WC881_06150 [Elusimicrobiota bacterium]|jgi:hypothetical protein